MTLYIDTKLTVTDTDVVSTVGSWHPSLPLLAIGSYHQEKGGFVTIFQENVSTTRSLILKKINNELSRNCRLFLYFRGKPWKIACGLYCFQIK